MNDIDSFVRIAGDNPFRQWLENQRDQAVRTMAEAVDEVTIYRAQGVYRFAEKQLKLLEMAKSAR